MGIDKHVFGANLVGREAGRARDDAALAHSLDHNVVVCATVTVVLATTAFATSTLSATLPPATITTSADATASFPVTVVLAIVTVVLAIVTVVLAIVGGDNGGGGDDWDAQRYAGGVGGAEARGEGGVHLRCAVRRGDGDGGGDDHAGGAERNAHLGDIGLQVVYTGLQGALSEMLNSLALD